MARRIEKLTAEQTALMPQVRDEWLHLGLLGAPADRKAAEQGVTEAYRAADLEPPRIVIWLDSPLAGAIGTVYLQRLLEALEVRRGQVRDQVGLSLWGENAGFLSWCDYWRRIGLEVAGRAAGLISVARSAGWWWALRGAVVLTERPRCVKLDDSGRLHAEDGPAIVYPDGFAVYAWHGLRVARELIAEPIQLEQIKMERNTELRRMLTERYGQDRWLLDGGAQLVSQDDWGKLWRLDQPGDEPLVMVEMVNSTPEPDGSGCRTYFERVPPNMTTPLGALAWQADLTPAEYARMGAQS